MDKYLSFFVLFILVAGGIALVSAHMLQSGASFFTYSNSATGASPPLRYTVSAGDTWGKIAESLKLSPETGLALLEASKKSHSLEDLRAGNALALVLNITTNEPEKLVYDIDDELMLIIERDLAGFFAYQEDIPYDIQPTVGRGTIENSLFETAKAQGVPDSVILNMAWIFSWDIDFAASVKKGDSFAVLYEERFRDGISVSPGRVLAAQFTNEGKDFYSFYYVNPEGTGDYYDANGKELKRQFLKSPLDYRRITSGFSYNRFNPILETFTKHRAIDYGAAPGTPVSATAGGTVIYAGYKGQHGIHIEIRHANGYVTGYSHLSGIARGIKVNVRVSQNQVIGFVGATGLATGPHLHYEMKKDGVLINPLTLDLPPGKPLKDEWRPDFFKEKEELLKLLRPTL